MDESTIIACSAALIIAHILKKRRDRRRRRWWSTNIFLQRSDAELVNVLKSQEVSGQYKNFLRMSSTNFEELLQKVAPAIVKRTTVLRKPISAQDRLALTLRFLATGDSYTSLQYTFKISRQAVSCIVPEVCSALVEALKDYLKLPSNPAEWKKVSEVFKEKWNLPNCVGAMDGKHVVLQAPVNSGSEFFNYKANFSIVLFALVDAEYNFLYADVGCQGRISDGGMFNSSQLYKKINNKSLGLPVPEELPGRRRKIPYFIAADSPFPLMENVLKPYPGINEKGSIERNFNYRLSRGRRTVENVFGQCSSTFRVLRKPMLLQPEVAELIVMAVIHLHNYLKKHGGNGYMPLQESDSCGPPPEPEPTSSFLPVRGVSRRSNDELKKNRDELAQYFMNEGAVPWQFDYA